MASYDDLDSLLDTLAQSAVEADMWERGFVKIDSHYENRMLFKKVYPGNPGANDLGQSGTDHTDYEGEIFNRWPALIQEIFAAWGPDVIPDPKDFQSQIDALRSCAAAIPLPALIEPPNTLRATTQDFSGDGSMGALVVDLHRTFKEMEGAWIDAFFGDYLIPLPYVIGNQGAMLDVLVTAIEAEQEMWAEVRQTIADLASAGAEWFDSVKFDGNVWELVISVGVSLGYVFTTAYAARRGKVLETLESINELGNSLGDVKTLIDSNVPPNPKETGHADNVEGIKTQIAQTLEYSLNDHITYTEERLRDLVRGSLQGLRQSRGTFCMGNQHLSAVANAGRILSRNQTLGERQISRSVKNLQALSDEVTAAASGIVTSVYPFVRPGGIGLGGNGPYDVFLEFENAISDAMHDTAFNLERVASAVRVAAEYAFSSDAEAAGALDRANDKLEKTQTDLTEQFRPPGRGESPYTAPDVEVYVDTPDCAPPVPVWPAPSDEAPRPPLVAAP